jgi:hypothetical protein
VRWHAECEGVLDIEHREIQKKPQKARKHWACGGFMAFLDFAHSCEKMSQD